jgi:peptide chain release factor 1
MYEEIKQKYEELSQKLQDPSITSDIASLTKISKEQSKLRASYELILELEKTNKNLSDNQEIIKNETDSELKNLAENEISGLNDKIATLQSQLEEELSPKSPNDQKDAIIEIRAGTGGDESALFTADLFKMYAKYAETKNFKVEILTTSVIGIGGYKEIIFEIHGAGAYGLFKHEAGTHRVQRVPETEKQGRIHTSTSTVVVLPEAEEVDMEIKASDIRIDTFCSSGPGGQSVNTTYSAVRVLHVPTGMIVSCQDQKSQHQNREKALQILRSRLLAKAEEDRQRESSEARKIQVGAGDRSDKIRTYNFPQDRITDHRINQSWHNINVIMNGDLEEMIMALRKGLK